MNRVKLIYLFLHVRCLFSLYITVGHHQVLSRSKVRQIVKTLTTYHTKYTYAIRQFTYNSAYHYYNLGTENWPPNGQKDIHIRTSISGSHTDKHANTFIQISSPRKGLVVYFLFTALVSRYHDHVLIFQQ